MHAYSRTEGIAGIIISDLEYPHGVAQRLLSNVVDEFLTKHPLSELSKISSPSPSSSTSTSLVPFPELTGYLAKFQDPKQADSIMKIQAELDEAKISVLQTFDELLERGTKIETLLEKSNDVTKQSAMFYTQVCPLFFFFFFI